MAFDFTDTGLFWDTPERQGKSGPREDVKIALARRLQGMAFEDTYVTPELRDPPPGYMAYDLETEDPEINLRGASWAFRGIGKIIGVAVAWEGFSAYYAIGHCSGNVDAAPVMAWLLRQFKRPDLTLICANANYDIGWSRRELGLYPAGGVVDVQFGAALLDEYKNSYSLDSISYTYLKRGKATDRLKQLEQSLGCKHSTLMGVLKELPGPVIASYACGDAENTRDIHKIMLPLIEQQGLLHTYNLESKLIPMSVEMRRIGIPVNVEKAQAASDDIKNNRIPELQSEIKRLCGVHVEPWVATTCEAALATFGYVCKRTPNGGPQVDASVLEPLSKINPVAQHIFRLRKLSKAATTFLDGHILYHQFEGRVHTNFNQLRSERDDETGFGTVTGRFSATSPGLQQIPVRDKEIGPLIRGMFEAETGEVLASLDYSSQEPRLAAHFALLANQYAAKRNQPLPCIGAEEIVTKYIENPRLDFHQHVADLAGIERGPAKTLNLGLLYGMGGAKLARSLGLPTQWMRIIKTGRRDLWEAISPDAVEENRLLGYQVVEVAGDEAKKVIAGWEKAAPFVRGLFKECTRKADERGFIVTIGRRRCRFESNGNGGYQFTHKALNRVCQSGAAGQTKEGLLALWEAGIVPRLTVHDENVFSVGDRSDAEKLVPYMVNAVKLVVPSVVDVKTGKSWGDIPK